MSHAHHLARAAPALARSCCFSRCVCCCSAVVVWCGVPQGWAPVGWYALGTLRAVQGRAHRSYSDCTHVGVRESVCKCLSGHCWAPLLIGRSAGLHVCWGLLVGCFCAGSCTMASVCLLEGRVCSEYLHRWCAAGRQRPLGKLGLAVCLRSNSSSHMSVPFLLLCQLVRQVPGVSGFKGLRGGYEAFAQRGNQVQGARESSACL